MSYKLREKLGRRKMLTSLGTVGAGATLLSFQNCAPGFFTLGPDGKFTAASTDPGAVPTPTPSPNSSSACTPATSPAGSIFAAPAKPPTANAGVTQVNGVNVVPVTSNNPDAPYHSPNARFYKVPYFDHVRGMQLDQYLLTADVGLFDVHSVATNDPAKLTVFTDISVFNTSTGDLLFNKRLGADDITPSAMFLLGANMVGPGKSVTVVSGCITHGYFSQVVDLSAAPLPYSGAVAPFAANTAFGTSSLLRPYVSVDATGGQGNISPLHAPHFHTVTDTSVQVTLGPKTAKHGQFAEFHYVAGGLLYDQNGNLLALASEQTYDQSANHSIVFDNVNLTARNVMRMRVVVFDTYNGFLMGFYQPTVTGT